jgi:hypothetical protein
MSSSIVMRHGVALLLLAIALAAPGLGWADYVQLVNGDMLHGRVLGLDEKQLRLESDVHGKLSIPRDKVVAITFGERKPVPAAVPAAPAASAGGLDDILQQLRAGAGGAGDAGELQKLMPLLSNPSAMKFFQDKVGGLKDGSLSVQDIRREAIRARDMVKDLKLGPDAEQALAPYLGILDRFIREADPARGKEGKK